MSKQLALEGPVIESPRVDIEKLRADLSRAIAERDEFEAQLLKAKRTGDRVIEATALLRQHLEPFYRYMQVIFGDMDEIVPPSFSSPASSPGVQTNAPGMDARTAAVWESWKQNMPGVPADIITALLSHPRANAAQLKVLCKRDVKTIYNAIKRMKAAGLVIKASDGKFELKQLS